jgi:predicted aminopeptidase
VIFAMGCSPFYVMSSALEGAKILLSRRPVEKLLERDDLSPLLRERLLLAQKVRDYSANTLGLRVGKSYASYSPTERTRLVTVVSAAPRFGLEPHTWWFPIVGRVPYKGYFDREAALAEARSLEEKGYDVFLAESDAFSTLGWFGDPIQSQFLRYDRVAYVDLLVHELFHGTVYVAGQANFNESAAMFAGRRGTIAFFAWLDGEGSESHAKALARWEESLRFSRVLTELLGKLSTVYDSDLPLEEKTARKKEVFAWAAGRDAELKSGSSGGRGGFLKTGPNNAAVLYQWLYHRDLSLFEEAHRLNAESLPRTLEWVRASGAEKSDPFGKLRGLVQSSSDSRARTP